MESITIKNDKGTELEIRVFEDMITFFVKPAKYSRYWIPISINEDEGKKIKELFKAYKGANTQNSNKEKK